LRLTESEAKVWGIEKLEGKPIVTKKRGKSEGEETLAFQLKTSGIEYEREVKFHPSRRWRFDFALRDAMLAVEVEGGVYTQGRHTRGKSWEMDAIKYAEAELMGWHVMRFSTGQVKTGLAIDYIRRFIGDA